MNVLILAAGYATRLYPLTLNKAKPLLEVAGKPMIEWVLDNIAPIHGIDTVYVVTNNKFAHDFREWADGYAAKLPDNLKSIAFKIVNDGSTSDDDKKGAIGDIHLVLNQEHLFNDDLIVVAGDNLFSEPVTGFGTVGKAAPATIAVYDVGDLELALDQDVQPRHQRDVAEAEGDRARLPRARRLALARHRRELERFGLVARVRRR